MIANVWRRGRRRQSGGNHQSGDRTAVPQTKVIPESFGDVLREEQRATVRHDSDARQEKIHAIPVRPPNAGSTGIVEAVYRTFEIVLASVGLIVASPVMVLTAIVVRLDSPGPVLFRHKRPARSICVRGRDLEARSDLIPPPGGYERDAEYCVPNYFTLIKFRTMYRDARSRFPEYYHAEYVREDFRNQYSHVQNDPRITRAGRVLRALSVDELPNLWSVVTGDMRLVGPRPEAPEALQFYTPEEMIKFTCKPGITGLAQVGGRGLLNWGDTLALDLQYVRTRSVALDLKIILLTIKRVIARHGAL
jgi:lipopolysaccharide/colanic/teichoic acid biosynthesis glycosyltransferase